MEVAQRTSCHEGMIALLKEAIPNANADASECTILHINDQQNTSVFATDGFILLHDAEILSIKKQDYHLSIGCGDVPMVNIKLSPDGGYYTHPSLYDKPSFPKESGKLLLGHIYNIPRRLYYVKAGEFITTDIPILIPMIHGIFFPEPVLYMNKLFLFSTSKMSDADGVLIHMEDSYFNFLPLVDGKEKHLYYEMCKNDDGWARATGKILRVKNPNHPILAANVVGYYKNHKTHVVIPANLLSIKELRAQINMLTDEQRICLFNTIKK